MLCEIIDGLSKFFLNAVNAISMDVLFFIVLAVEAFFAIFFLVKSLLSYEASLNRSLEKLNYWLFDRKVVTEDNIKELNLIFKTKAPKRLCYYWQQFILFRDGSPSTYLSVENLIEKPLKTSSLNSNIKNLTLLSVLWALIAGMFVAIGASNSPMTGLAMGKAISLPVFVGIIAVVFIVFLRARKNSILNSLYQNVQLFGRFMDNACIDLPTYIDYQILFTPQEIENGQPVLREFLDFKARKEKEEFNKAKEENVKTESYDFSSTGVDGSIVLDRAMRESELYLKKKEKILLQISQLESQMDSHRKNFDNVQKDYQTKIQASKENVDRLRQMQEETTNRIESNYYRKQQTQEIGKQEQLEQEFEQQRAKYMLEKNEGEEEIAKLNAELEQHKVEAEKAMVNEYNAFFDKFCKSAEKVVAKVFEEKISALKNESENDKEYITELEIKLKNKPSSVVVEDGAEEERGVYDENGNYVYANGTFYDKDGNFHDEAGNVYSQDGKLISSAEVKEEPKEKQIVDFDDFDAFDFMTDTSQKEDVYEVAENVINSVDDNFVIVNNAKREEEKQERTVEEPVGEELPHVTYQEPTLEEIPEQAQEETLKTEVKGSPVKKRGRPKKVENKTEKPSRSVGRPRKIVTQEDVKPKKSVGRPKKIIKEVPVTTEKRGRGRPKKINSIEEINKRLSEEEEKINELRNSLNKDLQTAMNDINFTVDEKMTRREELIKEIETLQNEAKEVISRNEPESQVVEINAKLEALLEEIKKLK